MDIGNSSGGVGPSGGMMGMGMGMGGGSGGAPSAAAFDLVRRHLVTVQRDHHHLLAENAALKEQNYQLSQSLNIVVSKLTQLGYRVEPPFDISGQIKRVREVREEAMKNAEAASAAANAAMGLGGSVGSGGGIVGGVASAAVPRRRLLPSPPRAVVPIASSSGGEKAAAKRRMLGSPDGDDSPDNGQKEGGEGAATTHASATMGRAGSSGGVGAGDDSSSPSPLGGTSGSPAASVGGGGGGAMRTGRGQSPSGGGGGGGRLSSNDRGGAYDDDRHHRPLYPQSRFRCVAELKEHKSHVQSAAFAPYFGEDNNNGNNGGGSSSAATTSSNGTGGGPSSSPTSSSGPSAFAFLATGAFDSRINLWRIPSSVMNMQPLLGSASDVARLSSAGGASSASGPSSSSASGAGGRHHQDPQQQQPSSSFSATGATGGAGSASAAATAAAAHQLQYPAPAKYSSIASIVNGHSRAVSALSWCYDYGGLLISSSFDGTSKVWGVEGCTGLRPQCPPAPVHSIAAPAGAYMVANCALSGRSYACADSRNNAYVVDYRANSNSGNGGIGGGGMAIAAGGAGATTSSSVSWAHPSRITSLAGDPTNPNLLLTAYANGTVRVWDLRLTAQPIAVSQSSFGGAAVVGPDGAAAGGDGIGFVDGIPIPPNASDRLTIGAALVPQFSAAAAFSGGRGGESPFGIVAEWPNDDSRAPVWHLALTSSSSPSAASSSASPLYNSSLLSIAEDGMARVYSVNTSNTAAAATPATTDNAAAKATFTFRQALRTLVPGLHSRGMPIKASLWLGATYAGKNPFVFDGSERASSSAAVGQSGGGIGGAGSGNDQHRRKVGGGSGGGGGSSLHHRHDGGRNGNASHRHQNAFHDDDDDDDDDDDEEGNAPSSPMLGGGGGADGLCGEMGHHMLMKGASCGRGGLGMGPAGAGGSSARARCATTRPHESDLLIVGSATGNASVFDVTDPNDPVFLEVLEGHKSLVTGVSVLPPSQRWRRPLIATYSNDHTVRLYTTVGPL